MKRRIVKKRISWAEKMLASETRYNLPSCQEGDELPTNGLLSILTYLVSHHANLENSWPHKERWFDFITDRWMHAPEPNHLIVKGTLVWAFLMKYGNGYEPFEAEIELSNGGKKIVRYSLKFGSGKNMYSFCKGKRPCVYPASEEDKSRLFH
jgi:hypothetical protein